MSKEGDQLKCISSKSNAYKLGEVYEVTKDKTGVLVLTGKDGLTDPLSRLVSKFQKVKDGIKSKSV